MRKSVTETNRKTQGLKDQMILKSKGDWTGLSSLQVRSTFMELFFLYCFGFRLGLKLAPVKTSAR